MYSRVVQCGFGARQGRTDSLKTCNVFKTIFVRPTETLARCHKGMLYLEPASAMAQRYAWWRRGQFFGTHGFRRDGFLGIFYFYVLTRRTTLYYEGRIR